MSITSSRISQTIASGADVEKISVTSSRISQTSVTSKISQATTESMRLADEKRDREVILAKLRAHYLQRKASPPAVLENADYSQLKRHWQRLRETKKIEFV